VSVENLVNAFAEQCTTPEWFGFQNKRGFRKGLKCFLPGNRLDDVFLCQLLQMISLPHGLIVIDSLGLDVTRPAVEEVVHYARLEDVKGLVFPFNVNFTDQANALGRNHWALGIFDYETRFFTAFDVSTELCNKWKESLDHALQSVYQTPSNMELNVHAIVHAVGHEQALNNLGANRDIASTEPR
jgi:hypothetical protein